MRFTLQDTGRYNCSTAAKTVFDGVAHRVLELPTRGRSGPGRGGQQLRRALNGVAPRGPAKLWRAGVLSGLIVETTATWDVLAQGFVLHTPSDTAAKNWISQGYTLGII